MQTQLTMSESLEYAGVEMTFRDGTLLLSNPDFSAFLDADPHHVLRHYIFGHKCFKAPTLVISETGFLQVDMTFSEVRLKTMTHLLLCVLGKSSPRSDDDLKCAAVELGVFDLLRHQFDEADKRTLQKHADERASVDAVKPIDDRSGFYDWLVSPPMYTSTIFMEYNSIKLADQGYTLVHTHILSNGLTQVTYRRKARVAS
jgi:hypothetical protein